MKILFEDENLVKMYKILHPDNLSYSKFNIGQRVRIIKKVDLRWNTLVFDLKELFEYYELGKKEFVVGGMNDCGEEIEYLLEGYPYLVWEHELIAIEKRL